MISKEDRLKIQAWVDGELAPKESAQILELIENSLTAKELANDLRGVRQVLKNGEKTVKIQDSPEFYWDQIQQKIESLDHLTDKGDERLESKTTPTALQWLIPVGSLAAISALIMHFNDPEIGQGVDTDTFRPAESIGFQPKSGLSEGSGIGLIEEEVSEGSELGVFSFEGTQIGGDLINPEEAGALPESIENPER
tara:strand:+ start:1806 stop:2393 length:588 start_codon:yes stop_codon:yes gene_type:complete